MQRGVYPVGSFTAAIMDGNSAGPLLRITHRSEPGRTLWESIPGTAFVTAAKGQADIREHGSPEGSFDVRDQILKRCDRQSVTDVKKQDSSLTLSGILSGQGCEIAYHMTLETAGDNQLRFQVRLEGPGADDFNRIFLRYASTKDEHFFGFGQQLTYFNQKGKVIPILVQEHGVGRGKLFVTQFADYKGDGGGGDPYVTEAPAPHYISSLRRSLFLENEEYSVFDLSDDDSVQVNVFSNAVSGRILYGKSPLDLIEEYTSYAGRMRPLPDWIQNGAVISVQGGTERAQQILAKLVGADVPLAGFWIQDWPGKRVTSIGSQLWWNWKLDESLYPQWKALVSDLAKQKARMLIYINPFLTDAPGHDELFKEAKSAGYLVKKKDDTPYLIKNTDFSAGLVDLSNPGAREWIKGVIKNEMINHAEASGWMTDFGEALPFDAQLYDNADPAVWHNRYPVEWARVNREAIEEAGRGDDIVFFNRSGFTRSPGAATLFWLGDQLQTWDEYDGIKSAVVGLQSGGVSGFSLLHADTGGYNAFSATIDGKKIPVIARTKELLMRWMELSAFTVVFRTHEGLDPSISAQIDTDAQTLAHLSRCAKIYKALAFYRTELIAEAARTGHPVVRHPFLQYPDDPNTYALRYQFTYGSELMVAPVLDKGAQQVKVYLPRGDWVNLWTGESVNTSAGQWLDVPAPLGKPALFYRKDSPIGARLIDELKAVGVW